MNNRILKHIGLALLLVLPLWGCWMEPSALVNKKDGLVHLKLDIDIPDYGHAVTKTDFVDTPTCSRLFVIVFNEAGMSPYVVEARKPDQTFIVDLQPSALPRTLHFLALPSNSPLVTVLSDEVHGKNIDEAGFASRLAIQNGDAACWARKVLSAGISSTTNLSGIKMVRNYAKVYILNSTDNFQLESFRVYNASKYGMAVPFNGLGVNNTAGFDQDLFPTFFDNSGNMREYAHLHDTQGYRGYPHPSGQLRSPKTSEAGSFSSYLASDGDGLNDACDYVFETRYNSEKGNGNPYILFKGKFSATKDFDSVSSTWYKADFVYDPNPAASSSWGGNDLLPYDILRNYAYVLTISGVIGEGHPTAEYAASQPARNNFNGSIEGQDISGVSELNSALYLSHTSIELARTAGVSSTFIDLYYRNEYPKGSEANVPDTDVLITVSGHTIITSSAINQNGTINTSASGVTSETIASTDPSIAALHLKAGNWHHLRLPVTIDPNGTGTLQQTITIKNRAGLSRHCVVSVREHFPFEIEGYKKNPSIIAMERVEPANGDVIPVYFKIPDGIPANLFPLVFKVESYSSGNGPTGATDVTRQVVQPSVLAIEDYKRSLGSGDYRIDMPVEGNSNTIVGADANDNADLTFGSYHYTRTVTWAEYDRAVADVKSMKSFPIFMEPQYDPRDAAVVTPLGTTTIWMRQGERDATFFSYKDDAGICTRRLAYELRYVDPTRIVLPAGDDTYDGKPVYEVQLGVPINLTISVVSASSGNPTPNPLTLSKGGASEFSLSTTEGTGSLTTRVTVSSVTGNLLPVTVTAGTAEEGMATYGGTQEVFYIRTLKGSRTVTFPNPSVTVLRNQTITSAYDGVHKVEASLLASSSTPITGNFTYSLASDRVVTSNEYVEIVQTGGNYTLRGKAVTNGVTLYAIAAEDDNYVRAYGEMTVVVKQGVITQDGWWTGATNGYENVSIPITDGTITYDDLYTTRSKTFEQAIADGDITFEASPSSSARVDIVNGSPVIVPLVRSASSSSPTTITMHVRGTDDNGDGRYGQEGDVFAGLDVAQSMIIGWRVWTTATASLDLANSDNYDYSSFEASTSGLTIEFNNCEGKRDWLIVFFNYRKNIGKNDSPGSIILSLPDPEKQEGCRIIGASFTYFKTYSLQTVTSSRGTISNDNTVWTASSTGDGEGETSVTITMDCTSSSEVNAITSMTVDLGYWVRQLPD